MTDIGTASLVKTAQMLGRNNECNAEGCSRYHTHILRASYGFQAKRFITEGRHGMALHDAHVETVLNMQ